MADARTVDIQTHTGELDGEPVYWREGPTPDDRSPVLYVHGVPTSSDDWVPFLERTGGVAPDLPGFGRTSKRGDLDYSIAGIDRFVERFLADRGDRPRAARRPRLGRRRPWPSPSGSRSASTAW